MNSESVRQKAIRFINELQTEEDDKFMPYMQERDKVGLLLNTKRKSKSTTLLNAKARLKNIHSLASITKLQPSQSMKSNPVRHRKEPSKLELSLLINLEEPTIEEQMRAKKYKEMMEKKALLEMYERKKDTTVVNPVFEQMIEKLNQSIQKDKFVWKMSNVDKGKNLGYLFHESKLRKHNRKTQKIQPSPTNYEPNYECVFPKSISIVIKPSEKQTYSQQIQEFIKKNQLDKVTKEPLSTVSKKDNTLEKMYSVIQNQITREVNQSLISNPQTMNPLEEFSAKPIEDSYIQQFHLQVKQKIKETNRARKNIQNKIQEFDSYLQKYNN